MISELMDYFRYQNNELYCEDIALSRIVEETGTPVYVYSAATFRRHFELFKKSFAPLEPLICFSVKCCGNIHILRLLRQMGSGFDVVSGGELYRVQQAGGEATDVVYAGVGKTDEEIAAALEAGIAYFNVESSAEMENIIRLAAELGKQPHLALRVNPDIDPKTHRHTTTGKKQTKFGIDLERVASVFETYAHTPGIHLDGVHLHIGSPVNTVEPYVQAIEKTLRLIDDLRSRGFVINTFNMGGGFGADYTAGQAPGADEYARAIVPLLKGKNLRFIMELGRSIAGNAGVFLTKVLYAKKGGEKNFVIVDGGMNDLIRPALYDAYHFIWPICPGENFILEQRNEPVNLPGLVKVDVVGPICETGDSFARDRLLPPVSRDDILAVFTAGAYGFVMSSQYNARPRPVEVLVEAGSFRIIRRRETYEDLIFSEQ